MEEVSESSSTNYLGSGNVRQRLALVVVRLSEIATIPHQGISTGTLGLYTAKAMRLDDIVK
jgi:hypothetical protein